MINTKNLPLKSIGGSTMTLPIYNSENYGWITDLNGSIGWYKDYREALVATYAAYGWPMIVTNLKTRYDKPKNKVNIF